MNTIILPYEGEPVNETQIVGTSKEGLSEINWTEYNLYQTQEKILAYKIINDLIEHLEIQTPKKKGRPIVNIKIIIKCLLLKAYNNVSSRRLHSELIFYKGLGYIDKIYHFNTILKYLNEPSVTPILYEAMKELAEPLKEIEKYFAIDATGFSTFDKSQWKEVRLEFEKHHDYRKLHMICGVKTNIITAAYVTEGTANDSPYFKPLMNDTVKIFKVEEISADAGYLSRKNCNHAKALGAVPYIMPKKNSTTNSLGSTAWAKMVRDWKENPESFLKHYHKRSNAESTFSMIKRKFGNTLKGKLDTTKENEIMCKIVCHNTSVLVEALLSYNLKTKF